MSLFLITVLFAYVAFHSYLIWKLCAAFPALRGGWLVGPILFCLVMMAAPYVVFRLGRSSDYPRLASISSVICFTWAALLWWFVCLGVLNETWNLLARGAGLFWPAAKQAVVPARVFLSVAVPLVLAALAWALVEVNNIRLKTVEIEVRNMAAEAEPIRIAQITDLHLGVFMGRQRLQRTLDCVRQAKADLIVSTGDLTDSPAEEYPDLVAMLAAVDAPLGKYAVTGNHEYFLGLEQAVALHAAAGFKMLRGETVHFGQRLRLCGVDDPAGLWRGQPCNLDENAVLPPPGDPVPTVLLKHQPRINEASLGRFDLQLSGHTHGGQIFPWHFFSQMSYGYNHGLFELAGGSRLYVSRGSGTWGPPLRLFAPPEVTLIILKPRKDASPSVAPLAAAEPAGTKVPAEGPAAAPAPNVVQKSAPPPLRVGLRRSSYGLRAKNADDAWWVARAKEFAAGFPGAEPVITEIVSGYQEDGSTEFEFARPAGDAGATEHMTFRAGQIDHERALKLYDKEGVKAVLQVESGSADVGRCLEIVHRAFGRHPCVIGYGIDAEWHFTKGSADNAGRPVTDEEAKRWTEQVVGYDPARTLFIKHWAPRNLPPKYRHGNLWMLSDSQRFENRQELRADFARWAKHFAPSTVGYQFGYPDDKKWWAKLDRPPLALGKDILEQMPSCRYLFWVDFTADQVAFR